jgi:PKD repeat protein
MANLNSQFNSSVRSGVAPLTVNFTNISTGPYTSVVWDFGDGSRSTQINPSHQFISDNTYTVTLTIKDELNGDSESSTSISVFPESSETDATDQQGLFTTKRLSTGQINVSRVVSNSSTFTSNLPIDSTPDGSDFFPDSVSTYNYQCGIVAESMSGGTTVRLDHTFFGDYTGWFFLDTALQSDGEDARYGYISIAQDVYNNPTPTSESLAVNMYEIFSGGPEGRGLTTYKIVSISTGTNTMVLDRPAPNVALNIDPAIASAFCPSMAYTRATNAAGDLLWSGNETSSIRRPAMTRMCVDSLDTLDASSLSHSSGTSKGMQSFFGAGSDSGEAFSMNWMGHATTDETESLTPGSVSVDYPFVLWHKKRTCGLNLYDIAGETMIDEDSGLSFRYLRGGSTLDDHIFGKVFHTKKMWIITDQEMLAATQFNSNRNWTFPEPEISTLSTTTGVSDIGVTYYVTYRLREDGTPSSGGTSFGLGNAGLDPLHCRYVKAINVANATTLLQISADASKWYNTDSTNLSGFTVGNVDVIVGTGLTSTNYPDPDSFKYSAVTTSYGDLQNGVAVPNYVDLSLPYTLDDGFVSGNTDMHFGIEDIGLFKLTSTAQAVTYKMSTTCVAKNTEFNTTQNPTHALSDSESVYITEVALYNENNELLMVGKLNKPIEKNDKKFVTIKMELDL